MTGTRRAMLLDDPSNAVANDRCHRGLEFMINGVNHRIIAKQSHLRDGIPVADLKKGEAYILEVEEVRYFGNPPAVPVLSARSFKCVNTDD